MVQGFRGVDSPESFFSGPSGDAAFDLSKDDTIAVLFWWNGQASLGYSASLLSNAPIAAPYKGWNIQLEGRANEVTPVVLKEGSFIGVALGKPQLGLNAVVVSVDSKVMRASLNGGPVAAAGLAATPAAPDGTCTLSMGAAHPGAHGWDVGGVLAVAHLARTATDTEIVSWSGKVAAPGRAGATTAPASRYALPNALTTDRSCDVDWNADRDWDGTSSTSTSRGSSAVTWTAKGALSKVRLSEQWVTATSTPSTRSTMIDTVPPVLEKEYARASALGRYRFDGVDTHTQADVLVTVDIPDTNAGTYPVERAAIYVDGAFMDTAPPQGVNSWTIGAPQTWRYNLHAYDVAPGDHRVEIYAPPQMEAPGAPTGGFVVSLVTPVRQVFNSTPPRKRLVAGLDSIPNGFNVIAGQQGVGALMRARFPSSGGPGGTTVVGFGGYSIQDEMAGAGITGAQGGIAALAALVVAECNEVVSGGAKFFYDDEGFNTYNRALLAPSAWGAAKAQLYDAIHAKDAGIRIVYTNFPQSHFAAITNALGFTLADYNAAAARIAAGRAAFTELVDLTNARVTFSDNVHPDATPSGTDRWESAVRRAAGW